jgi:hypothetical protein
VWCAVIAAALALAAAVAVVVMMAGGGTAPDRGPVVARLAIPFRAVGKAGTTDVIPLRVKVGQRFSIWVDAVQYYAFWTEAARPYPQVVHTAGEFADATCSAQVAGCGIPYLYSFVARNRGTTTMTWKYRQGYTSSLPSVTLVAFDITVG